MTDTTALIAEATAWRNENPDDPQTELVSERVASLIGRLTDALEALSPQVVGTVEELDALPVGSVIRGSYGWVHELIEPGRWGGARSGIFASSYALRSTLPARVLFRPDTEGGES